MHISRIAVANFRNFAELDLRDLPETHVLVGENGTGKSNLLYALRLLLDPSLPDTARQLIADDFWDGLDAPFRGNQIRITVELTGFDTDDAAKALLSHCVVSEDPLVARLTFTYRPRIGVATEDAVGEANYEAFLYGADHATEPLRRDMLRYISLQVLPALRDAENDLAAPRSPLRRLLQRLEIDPAQLEKARDATAEAGAALLADTGVAAVNTGITEQMKSMVGSGFSLQTRLGIAPTEAEQLVRSIRLFIDDGAQRPISRASLGSANLLYLAMLLLLIEEQEKVGDRVTTVLGVEEPEAHLHPHVQRVLFRHLLAGRRALIVSTHSPHLASVAPLRSLTVLRQVDDHAEAYHARDVEFDDATIDDLQRYLDVSRAEILFAKGVILVEGAAEEFAIPAFATLAGLDLDAGGVSVCSVHGTDFAPYRRLLGSAQGLNIPNIVITDGDPNQEKGTLAGVTRALKLVGDSFRPAIKAARTTGDEDLARSRAADGWVFVGPSTLELDLLPSARDAMIETWNELNSGAESQAKFTAAVDGYIGGDAEHGKGVINRITRVGKGRYAQRLVAHLDGVAPPQHISAALDVVARWGAT